MITQIEGRVVSTRGGRVELRCGPMTYAILVAAADEQRLATMLGETVRLHTLHYLEAQGQGSSMIPRLIGFTCEDDRAFFELFTTVKGMGSRKALRAIALPIPVIAGAIAERDVDVLKSLPEVGKRTAETIVAALHGKVDRFVEAKPGAGLPETPETAARRALVNDVVGVLTQLGEGQLPARRLVERALAADPTIGTAEALLDAAYRLKEGSEGARE